MRTHVAHTRTNKHFCIKHARKKVRLPTINHRISSKSRWKYVSKYPTDFVVPVATAAALLFETCWEFCWAESWFWAAAAAKTAAPIGFVFVLAAPKPDNALDIKAELELLLLAAAVVAAVAVAAVVVGFVVADEPDAKGDK